MGIIKRLLGFQQEIGDLKSAAIRTPVPSTSDQSNLIYGLRDIQKELKDTQANKQKAEEAWMRVAQKAENLEDENQDLIEQVKRLRQALSSGGSETLIEDILHVLTPRTAYYGKSLTIIQSMADPTYVFEKIKILDNGGQLPKSKTTNAAAGWRHDTVSTGSSNDLRLYYRPEAGGVWVSLGYKRDQKRDIRQLPQFNMQ